MRRHFLGFFILFISVLGVFSLAHAGPQSNPHSNIPATCDGEFYNVMTNRAWMEGKREMEAAQTIILKADSVLEYSCFDNPLGSGGACGDMYALWDLTKCTDFDIGNFTLLSAMATNDLRKLPAACQGPAIRQAHWEQANEAANPLPASPSALGGVDTLVTYVGALSAGNCSNDTPLETGLEIIKKRKDGSEDRFDDKVCLKPGCNYNRDTDKCASEL